MKEENFVEVHHASHRSFMCNFGEVLPSRKFRLLRVLKAVSNETESRYNLDTFFQLVNLRHLAIISMMYDVRNRSLPSSICFLWNLQTLIFRERSVNGSIVAPPEIWKMHLLRHIEIQKLYLPDPSSGQMDKRDDFVLGDLQTLLKIENFKCSDEVVKRIPNVKKLRISYQNTEEGFEVASHYCLNNLSHLHKLESLRCFFSSRPSRSDLVRNLTFPHTLKKLILHNNGLYWEDMNTNIGSLPHLEVLKLFLQSFIGPKWETVEGKFPSLRHLEISSYDDVEYWTTESNHFPLLERLALLGFKKLQEMPSDIGEIPTLKSIHLVYCSESAVMSANQILEEQEELGNEGLRVRVFLWEENHQVQSLARRNFEVIC